MQYTIQYCTPRAMSSMEVDVLSSARRYLPLALGVLQGAEVRQGDVPDVHQGPRGERGTAGCRAGRQGLDDLQRIRGQAGTKRGVPLDSLGRTRHTQGRNGCTTLTIRKRTRGTGGRRGRTRDSLGTKQGHRGAEGRIPRGGGAAEGAEGGVPRGGRGRTRAEGRRSEGRKGAGPRGVDDVPWDGCRESFRIPLKEALSRVQVLTFQGARGVPRAWTMSLGTGVQELPQDHGGVEGHQFKGPAPVLAPLPRAPFLLLGHLPRALSASVSAHWVGVLEGHGMVPVGLVAHLAVVVRRVHHGVVGR